MHTNADYSYNLVNTAKVVVSSQYVLIAETQQHVRKVGERYASLELTSNDSTAVLLLERPLLELLTSPQCP